MRTCDRILQAIDASPIDYCQHDAAADAAGECLALGEFRQTPMAPFGHATRSRLANDGWQGFEGHLGVYRRD
jgi:hypothetical protein